MGLNTGPRRVHASMLSREWLYIEPHGHISTAPAGAGMNDTMVLAGWEVYPGWPCRVPGIEYPGPVYMRSRTSIRETQASIMEAGINNIL